LNYCKPPPLVPRKQDAPAPMPIVRVFRTLRDPPSRDRSPSHLVICSVRMVGLCRFDPLSLRCCRMPSRVPLRFPRFCALNLHTFRVRLCPCPSRQSPNAWGWNIRFFAVDADPFHRFVSPSRLSIRLDFKESRTAPTRGHDILSSVRPAVAIFYLLRRCFPCRPEVIFAATGGLGFPRSSKAAPL